MARLKSVFSWSFSAAEDFEQCRRGVIGPSMPCGEDGKLLLQRSRKLRIASIRWIIGGD